MRWTEVQSQTIEIRDKNILVSAAAGSGKTAVLIERIKQLILKDKVDIDRFLITTFTNAAAAEMKERLEKTIREEINKPDADKIFLKRQLKLLPKAGISTFHTFALEVMHRYFYLTDLDPGFKIGDDILVSIMKGEATDELFDIRFNEDYDSFKEFLKKYSSDRNEKKIKSNIISLYNELRSIPHYLDWAESRTELLNEESPIEALGITNFIIEETASELKEATKYYQRAAYMLEEAGIDSLAVKAQQDADNARQLADLALTIKAQVAATSSNASDIRKDKSNQFSHLRELLSDISFNQMRASKAQQEDYDEIKEQVSDCRKKGKKLIDDLTKKYFQLTLEEYDEELREGYEDTKYMVGLIRDFEAIFREKKRERNIVDFDDVMHYAIEILTDDMAAGEYRDRFRYIFVDEFQDSNMLQETIVGQIAGENNLFMVGDVKQSIYKFRLAEPEIFKRKYALYKKSSETGSTKIDLNSNFRSKQRVTETVNTVFESIMEDYDENARLHCTIGDNHPGYKSSLHIISRAIPEGEEQIQLTDSRDNEETLDGAQAEAALAAQLISENIGKPIYDVKKDETRPIKYKDIVILSRNKSMIGEIERYLNNEGIPAYGENTGGYFESVEIQVFLNIMRIIDNTNQDIPLISAMRSVIFDFDVKELAAVRIASREGSFYQAVRAYAKEGQDEVLRAKITAMTEQLSYWKEIKKTVALEELVRILLYNTGYFDYCSGLPVGRQRASNLRLLVQRAADFEQNNYSGLYGFLSYVEAMRRSNLSIGEAKLIGENENVIRVMTVHKSKGLEFPVVILTGAGRQIKFRGIGSSAALHKDLAIGMPHVNREEHWHRKTILQRAIEGKKTKEELEEEVRILYVAMTRAMDRLMITGRIKDAEKLNEDRVSKKSFLEMIYAPMKSAEEEIIIHYDNELALPEKKRHINGREHFVQLFEAAASIRDEEKIEEIDKRLAFVYPYSELSRVKLKYTVTELNKRWSIRDRSSDAAGAGVDRTALAEPGFGIDERKLNAAQIGTAMHLVMEKLDFRQTVIQGEIYIEDTVDRLFDKDLLSEEERAAISIDNIWAFFTQDIGRRAAAAENLQKEKEFILQKEIDGVPAIVQGIIDCYFEEDDGLVLVDYKNSYVWNDVGEAEIAKRYSQQICIYEEALAASTGKKVKESYLYLFNGKKAIRA